LRGLATPFTEHEQNGSAAQIYDVRARSALPLIAVACCNGANGRKGHKETFVDLYGLVVGLSTVVQVMVTTQRGTSFETQVVPGAPITVLTLGHL